MYISVLKLKMRLLFSESLKDKRMVKNSLKDKIEKGFKVLVKEIEYHDDKKVIAFGIVYASDRQSSVEDKINKVLEFLERNYDFEIYDIEKYIEKF